MPYNSLYNRRQSEDKYLPRSWYISDAKSLQWVADIKIKTDTNLRQEAVRGLIYRRCVEMSGGVPRFNYTIIVPEGLPEEAERFIVIKELMHCYFGPSPENEKYETNNSFVFGTHVQKIFGDSALDRDSPHVRAESMALWMALGVICTEQQRLAYQIAIDTKDSTLEKIAIELKIPRKQVYNLTSNQYDNEISAILN